MLTSQMSRRSFARQLGMAAAAAALPGLAMAERTRKVKIGYTGITWSNKDVDQAIHDVGALGFYGFETFGQNIEQLDAEGGFEEKLHAAGVPLISGYCTIVLTDPLKKDEELAKAVKWSKLIKKYHGRIFVVGPNPVHRATYDYNANKANIVSMLNELASTVTDQGLTPVLHQHTQTCVMTRDETYATLDAVDTRVLKFGPDVGQLTNGGANAVQVVKDYLPIVHHMHLKDYKGDNPHLAGYCPLGQGVVNVPAILDLMNGRKIKGMIMGELDNSGRNPDPTPPIELVRQSKNYLESIGVKFRA
jgi:inosose dehydratase